MEHCDLRTEPSSGRGAPIARSRAVALVAAALAALAIALAGALSPAPALASSVVDEARALSESVSRLEGAIKSGDSDELRSCTEDIQAGVDSMREALDAGVWTVASFVPFVGGDVTKARELLAQADDLADNALAPLSEALQEHPLTELVREDGVDAEAVRSYAEVIAQVEPVFERVAQGLEGIGSFTISQLNDALDQVRDPVVKIAGFLSDYAPLVERLPEVLGCDGARTYLVIAQNNAEIRATGGYPGAWGTVTLDNGQATLGDFTTIVGKRAVTFDLLEDELAVFGPGMAQSPGNLNETPDFPRAAQLLSQAWEAYKGQSVDGVIAMDPRFLQDMLGLVGGVTASDGTVIDGTNAAWQLLNQTYWRYGNDGTAQDEFFAEVAGLAAEQLFSNISSASFSDLLDTLRRDGRAGRLLLWSADADVEDAIMQTSASGALPADPSQPVLGVYLNDETWAKMCWYLMLDTQVTGSAENEDGTVTYEVETTLTNTITQEEAASAPTYITGTSPDKRSVDDIVVKPLLVAPAGGSISDIWCSSGAAFAEGALYGHDVWTSVVNLGAQETVTITYRVTVAEGAGSLSVHQTPTGQGE